MGKSFAELKSAMNDIPGVLPPGTQEKSMLDILNEINGKSKPVEDIKENSVVERALEYGKVRRLYEDMIGEPPQEIIQESKTQSEQKDTKQPIKKPKEPVNIKKVISALKVIKSLFDDDITEDTAMKTISNIKTILRNCK